MSDDCIQSESFDSNNLRIQNVTNDGGIKKKNENQISSQKSSWNILAKHNFTKIDEKFILKLTKGSKNVNKEVRDCCKVFHFSSEWTFEEVLIAIDGLNRNEYPRLFIFIIEGTNFRFASENQQDFFEKLTKLQEKLLKFCATRPTILQMTSYDENVTKIYYKDETLNQFTVIDQKQNATKKFNDFSSFLKDFLYDNLYNFETEVLCALPELQNRSLILRFFRTLNVSVRFVLRSMIMILASGGTKAEFSAFLDTPFDSNERILSNETEESISDKYVYANNPENVSVLLTSIENENTEVIDYLITHWTHLIKKLPFYHRVKISTAAFESNQLDVLCDLLNIADYPFPDNFKPESIEHKKLKVIIAERDTLSTAIKDGIFDKIRDFISKNPKLNIAHNSSNVSAIKNALNYKRYDIFSYLESRGFTATEFKSLDEILSHEEMRELRKCTVLQRKRNVDEALTDDNKSINSLCNKSLIHDKRISKEKEAEYRKHIKNWYEEINIIIFGSKLLEIASSCEDLKIIFHFESESVEHVCLSNTEALGALYPSAEWIFIAAKSPDMRKQEIKGVLAQELCMFVISLVFENCQCPYYKHREDMMEMLEEIVKIIESSSYPDDECNGIISSVFTNYQPYDFHPSLIVTVVQILGEYDDNEDKSKYLQEKYKILFDFFEHHVYSEMCKFNLKDRQKKRTINKNSGLLEEIKNDRIHFANSKDINKMRNERFTFAITNIPRLLLNNILNDFESEYGQIFFRNLDIFKNYRFGKDHALDEIFSINEELQIIIDCTKGTLDHADPIYVKEKHNFVFIVSNDHQLNKLIKILEQNQIEKSTRITVNYNWSDLTQKSQELLLKRKINFQNNSEILMMDILKGKTVTEDQGVLDYSEIVDSDLLNVLTEKSKISLNSDHQDDEEDHKFNLLFQPRNFIRKSVRIESEQLKNECKGRKVPKISQDELISEVKNQKYVLISDQAGNGKSWAMKNFRKILREQNPTSWVTFVNLKQFIDKFKAQEGEPEFSTFMVENILKPMQKFEVKIFQKHYKDGKVFIIFDGYDEIAPDCAEFVSKLAQNFQSNDGNQLWITTRDYFEVDLQQKFQLDVTYSLDEMTEEEGVDLIAKGWILMDETIKNTIHSKKDLDEYAVDSRNSAKHKAQSIIKNIALSEYLPIGQPLLFKIIGDLFKVNKNSTQVISKLDVFENIADIIYKIWADKKGQLRGDASIKALKYELNFWRFHQYSALKSLLPTFAQLFFPFYDINEWPNEEIIGCGMLTIKNGEILFLHQIFRDFFIADYIIRSLKRVKIDDNFLKLFVTILTSSSYVIIQFFLNDTDLQDLKRIKPNMQKFIEKFYGMKNFGDLFIKGLANLAGFVIDILKTRDYDKVKNILHQCAQEVLTKTTDSKSFKQFQEFIFEFLKIDDLKDFILKQEMFQGLVQSSLKIEVFEDFVSTVNNNTNSEFVKNGLKLMSDENLNGNIFDRLCWSTDLSSIKVQNCLRIIRSFLIVPEIFELIKTCNKYGQNILHVVIRTGNEDKLSILWTAIEENFKTKDLKELATNEAAFGRNIFHYTAYSNEIDFHKAFWTLLMKTFTDKQELKRILITADELNDNFTFYLIESKKSAEIMELAFNKLKEKFTEDEFKEILKSKDRNGRNLLQIAAVRSTDIKTHQVLWKTFEDSFNNDDELPIILNHVDNDGCNLLHLTVSFSSVEIFEYILCGIEIVVKTEIRNMLINKDKRQFNILESSVRINRSVVVHEKLWVTLRKYCQSSEIEKLVKAENGESLIFIVIRYNTKEIVELTWKEIKTMLGQNDQVKYLSQVESDGRNILQVSSGKCVRQGVYESVHKFIQEYGM